MAGRKLTRDNVGGYVATIERFMMAVPEVGQPVELLPGLFWLRLKLPFALDHVNVWIVDDDDGWTLIDTGLGDAATKAIWQESLAGLLHGRPLRRIVATHFHPDHAGNVGSLIAGSDAELLMSRTEWLTARMLQQDRSEEFIQNGRWFDHACALPDDVSRRRAARGNLYAHGVDPLPCRFTRLRHGDQIRLGGSTFSVIVGEGHSPEQLTLHSPGRGLLIAADQVLPSISPNVAVWPAEPAADPLGDFLTTLGRYGGIDEDVLVLPSHKVPFKGLHARLAELRAHHEDRLYAALAACTEPSTASDVMVRLFPRALDIHQVGFALGETLAHLNRLIAMGRIGRTTRSDGRWLYELA